MKLQLEARRLRVRVDEAEFTRLLDAGVVRTDFAVPGLPLHVVVECVGGGAARLDTDGDTMHLRLPRAMLEAYRARLPCRDGVDAEQAGFAIRFEVDVRDSMRVRGPARPDAR